MIRLVAALCVLCISQAQASEVSLCEFVHGSTWKVRLNTDKPGEVHILSHCKLLRLEDMPSLRPEEVAAVVAWNGRVSNLDLSNSIYRYYIIVQNDHGSKLQVELTEWKVSHAPHLAVMGNGIEIPPCVSVAIHFLSPGPPKLETSYMQISLVDEKGNWMPADQARQMPVHVPASAHFVRGQIRVHNLPKEHASSAECK